MDRSMRQASSAVFLAAGCVFSASSHAYSAAEDAEAQDREVKAAYERGYEAAKKELAREAATKASAAANPPPATATSAQKATASPPRKPILDIKENYSDAGHVETVQEVPVTATPLPEQTGPQTPPSTQAHAVPQPAARGSVAVAEDDSPNRGSPQDQQAVRNANAQMRDDGTGPSTRRAVQQDVAPPEEAAYDDGGADAGSVDEVQQYATETPRYAGAPVQYAPPPVAMQQAPQPYRYVQQPNYAAPRPYAAYAPPPPWVSQYQPAPQGGRWVYWSPQYGRWLYY